MKKIKVLVVDDSALIRSLLRKIINESKDMEVIGVAPNPLAAREMIRTFNPDVLTLDVEMPKMDGLDFLEKLMRLRPMPVVMISSLTERGSETTFRALELGAVDFISKPKIDIVSGLEEYADTIKEKIRAASLAAIHALPLAKDSSGSRSNQGEVPAAPLSISTEKLIIVGASTGGTEAIKEFLKDLPADTPGIMIAQHMPEGFTRSFAARLNGLGKISVKEAESGERILPGHVYIAPGGAHLLLKRSGANYIAELSLEPPVNRHRPSVDVLFNSAASTAGKNAVGVILTGMGKDGAAGLLKMKQAGSYTFAQDESSCVVFGMPREAIERGAVDEVVPIQEMARSVMGRLRTMGSSSIRI